MARGIGAEQREAGARHDRGIRYAMPADQRRAPRACPTIGLCQPLVAGWKGLQRPRERLHLRGVPDRLRQGGQGVGLGVRKHEVEGDDLGPGRQQLLDETGQDFAAPGPCPDRRQRALVDIDDAHRVGGIDLARLQLLQRVEGDQPDPGKGLRIDPAQRRRVAERKHNRQPIHHPDAQDAPRTMEGRLSQIAGQIACTLRCLHGSVAGRD